MLIELSVTPWSVAPLASPLPHGDVSVPKFAALAAPVAAALALVACPGPVSDPLRLLLQAGTAIRSANTAAPMVIVLLRCTIMLLISAGPGGASEWKTLGWQSIALGLRSLP